MNPNGTVRLIKIVVAVIALVVVVSTLLLWPVEQSKASSIRSACLSNVKQLGMAAMAYAADADDHFPLASNWYTGLGHYTIGKALTCPSLFLEHPGVVGYAYDSRMTSMAVKSLPSPETHPLIYDSSSFALNTSDPFSSLPEPARHEGKNSIGFADGHAQSKRPSKGD